MSDALLDRIKAHRSAPDVYDAPTFDDMADRIEELEAKLVKKDGNIGKTYRRWQNGADLRVLAKEAGCTQERIRLKLKKYEEGKMLVLEAKLEKAVGFLELLDANYSHAFGDTARTKIRALYAELTGGQRDG